MLAINKMDLVDFDRGVFDGICDDFDEMLAGARAARRSRSARCTATTSSPAATRTPWFDGPSLLEFLETVEVDARRRRRKPFRFPVQLVLRPDHEFRGYAGQIASGTVRPGDAVTRLAVRPHARRSSASSPGTATSRWRTRRCRSR